MKSGFMLRGLAALGFAAAIALPAATRLAHFKARGHTQPVSLSASPDGRRFGVLIECLRGTPIDTRRQFAGSQSRNHQFVNHGRFGRSC